MSNVNTIITDHDRSVNLQILRYTAILLILAAMILNLHLVSRLKIHWDEFHYLSYVYSYIEGRSLPSLQTFHVHFFSWLPSVSSNEAVQVIVARFIIFLISIGSGIMIYKIGRIYLSKEGALFSTLCFFSYYNIVLHGNSFRMDPICSLLFLSSLYLILAGPYSLKGAILAGFMMGLSVMVTIKSSIHLLAIALIYLISMLSSTGRNSLKKHAAVFGATLLLSTVLLYLYHLYSMSIIGTATAYSGLQGQGNMPKVIPESFPYLKSVFSKMFLEHGLIPRMTDLLDSIHNSLIIWFYLIAGIILAFTEILRRSESAPTLRKLIPLLILPLTLIFYRNAWPYYYVFIMPPLFVFCGIAIDRILIFINRTRSVFLLRIVFLFFVSVFISMAAVYADNNSNKNKSQKNLVKIAHRIFPEPTPYIDAYSMISSYPKVGSFMSTWSIEEYRKKNVPVYRYLITTYHPLFLIANRSCINPVRMMDKESGSTYRLLEDDIEVILQNYIKYWDDIYVAGKMLVFTGAPEARQFEILIPGIYTLEAEDTVKIEGIEYSPGDRIMLECRNYNVSVDNKPMTVRLRWGENLYRPL